MKLIVGLGNPGSEYENTRHNTGFRVIDLISQEMKAPLNKTDFKGIYAKTTYHGEKVMLLKPQTYMNLSGEAIRSVMDYFHIDISELLVIYDDLDLPVGKIRLREQGSAGGQNGVKDIIKKLGTQQFARIRVGIGKDPRINAADYVLGKVRKEELEEYEFALVAAKDAAIDSVDHDFNLTMGKFNTGVKK